MLKQSDYVVTYVTHGWGGAAQFAEKAKRQGKTVVDLALALDLQQSVPASLRS